MASVLRLVVARWRFAPRNYVPPLLGVALAAGFVIASLSAGTIAGDRAARESLAATPPSARAFRVTSSADVTPALAAAARHAAATAGGPVSQSLLLDPVRLSGIVVRPAAIAPLSRWVPARASSRLGPCRPRDCPVLLPDGPARPLVGPGVRLRPVGGGALTSPVPLGYRPGALGSYPTPLTGDVAGLDALPGLSSAYRTRSWFAVLPADAVHGWTLAAAAHRLLAAQARLLALSPNLVVATPTAALDAARGRYAGGQREMLPLAAGGAAILLLFVLLSGTALRREQRAELARLRANGARTGHVAGFVVVEASGIAAGGLALGAVGGTLAAWALAGAAGEPGGAVLAHSGPAWPLVGALALIVPLLLALTMLARTGRAAELALAGAAAALIAGLLGGTSPSGAGALGLVCLATLAGAFVVWGVSSAALRALARVARGAPPRLRVAIVAIGRAPAAPGLAVGLAAAGLGLGGFALVVRATLARSAADQAAAQVPLDVRIGPGPDFRRPLALLAAAGWSARTGGQAFGVLDATASVPGRSGYASIPFLGVPAGALARIHGWRASDGSAPLGVLAARLRLSGPARHAGPELPGGTEVIRVGLRSPRLALRVSAVLRDPGGRNAIVALRPAGAFVAARVPRGRWELAAIELAEPTGLEVTTGHQNGENPVGVAQGSAAVRVGPVRFTDHGHVLVGAGLAGWRAVGAASRDGASPTVDAGSLEVRFAETGLPGVLRPVQPTDEHPLAVLADPATAAAAGPGGTLPASVGGLTVPARVVGTVSRFPTVGAGPLLVADAAALSTTLDAGAPGSGFPDELWLAGPDRTRLHSLLAAAPFDALAVQDRVGLERSRRNAALARSAQRLLLAEAALVVVLALVAIAGFVLWESDPALAEDLRAQGVGPRGLRAIARARGGIVTAVSLAAGIALSALLLVLVAPVARAIGGPAEPSYIVVVPAPSLVVLWLALAAGLTLAAWRPR